MLLDGAEQRRRERLEVARWICFHLYLMNPYIKGTKAHNPRSYIRFPWEEITEDEIEKLREKSHVTPEEQAELDRVFNEVFGNESRGFMGKTRS